MLFSWNEDPTYFTQLQQYTVMHNVWEHPTQNHKKLNIHAMSQSNKIIGLD